jgi:3-methyladenine DNA glycosylase AlkC
MNQLITQAHQEEILNLVDKVSNEDISIIVDHLSKLVERIRFDIPEKKRISAGRYSIIKELGLETYPLLDEAGVNVFDFASRIFDNFEHEPFVRSFAMQLISIYGLNTKDLAKTLPKFKGAAWDDNWIVRECSSGLFRKLTKAYPTEIHIWYLQMVQDKDPRCRRFVSESLRPVVENRWIHKDPDYTFSVIKYLYKESDPYPRTSVGNNLSDWMRVDEDRAWKIVEKLAQNGNKDSYWIAYRACRNLVKIKPIQVMQLLGVEKYKYKTRIYHLKDYKKLE